MIWYEWLDETWAVLRGIDLSNLAFQIKFLDIFEGREDPIEFDINLLCIVVCFICFELVETDRERERERERGRSVCSLVLLQKLLL